MEEDIGGGAGGRRRRRQGRRRRTRSRGRGRSREEWEFFEVRPIWGEGGRRGRSGGRGGGEGERASERHRTRVQARTPAARERERDSGILPDLAVSPSPWGPLPLQGIGPRPARGHSTMQARRMGLAQFRHGRRSTRCPQQPLDEAGPPRLVGLGRHRRGSSTTPVRRRRHDPTTTSSTRLRLLSSEPWRRARSSAPDCSPSSP